ncbi:hypothetical protein BGZ57DRAFT_955960 [Hyaloscypha finlandica]|nr:hypothetical protein BGZ57DRAFT_955960 [Hyaloscypha finlandica]
MPFVIDDIIGLVGIVIAVPGLVQTFIHASRWLSKRLGEISPSSEKTDIHRTPIESNQIKSRSFPGLSYKDAYIKAVDLARNVQFFNASNGLPELIDFQGTKATPLQDQRFTFVFAFPKDRTKPRSLRDVFLDPINTPPPPIPRNFRFILPRKLAESICHVHEQQLVHKCLRPESVLLFEPSPGHSSELKYPKSLGSPTLADWQYARTTFQVSRREAYDDWTLAMYQHPKRQALPGEVAESKYKIGHDIYSLDVCLLEIGLWDSFIIYDNNVPKLSHLLSEVKAKCKKENSPVSQNLTESQIKQKVYITVAGDQLSYEMGEAYSKLVIKV